MADYRSRRRDRLGAENNGEADDLDSSESPSKLEVGSESRVAARRRERERTATHDSGSPGTGEADAESRGAVGGAGAGAASGKKDKKGAESAKSGRFAHRKREKRRGTGLVVLQDEDATNATADVKANTDYNEVVSKKGDGDADHNGTTNSYETTNRRQATPIRDDESANGSSEVSRIRARRKQARESLESNPSASPSSPRSILRREVDGRTIEEWKRMYEREHRENRRLTRRLHESEERIARLEDEIQILTEDLEVVDEELDRSREENRALNKAMSNLRS